MKRNTIVSIATVVALAAGFAQAEDTLEQGAVIESGMTGAGGGSYEKPNWKEVYPFPGHFDGPANE